MSRREDKCFAYIDFLYLINCASDYKTDRFNSRKIYDDAELLVSSIQQ